MLDEKMRDRLLMYINDEELLATRDTMVLSGYGVEGKDDIVLEMRDNSGAAGALSFAMSVASEYALGDDFSHDELPFHVVMAMTAIANAVQDAMNALFIFDPTTSVVSDVEDAELKLV